MTAIWDFIQNNWVDILAFYGGLVVCVNIIVKLTPTPKDDAVWATVKSWLDRIVTLGSKKNS